MDVIERAMPRADRSATCVPSGGDCERLAFFGCV